MKSIEIKKPLFYYFAKFCYLNPNQFNFQDQYRSDQTRTDNYFSP